MDRKLSENLKKKTNQRRDDGLRPGFEGNLSSVGSWTVIHQIFNNCVEDIRRRWKIYCWF
jgi:hypothetical protein